MFFHMFSFFWAAFRSRWAFSVDGTGFLDFLLLAIRWATAQFDGLCAEIELFKNLARLVSLAEPFR